MKKIKKSLLLFCVFIMIASIGVYASATYGNYGIDFASAAYQSNINPYTDKGYNGSSFDGSNGECTWFVWGRVYEKLGIALPFTGNAKDWTANAEAVGCSTGTDARANSIMVEHYEQHGHVLFVEKVENGFAYVTEGNYGINSSTYHEDVINLSTMTRNGSATAMNYVDYIYLDDTPPEVSTPEITNASPSGFTVRFTATDDESGIDKVYVKVWEYGQTYNENLPLIEGSVDRNNIATVRVNTADFGGFLGYYYIACGAIDKAGNPNDVPDKHGIILYPLDTSVRGTYVTKKDTDVHELPYEEVNGKTQPAFA